MAHEIFEMRAIYDSKIDSLQLENMEVILQSISIISLYDWPLDNHSCKKP